MTRSINILVFLSLLLLFSSPAAGFYLKQTLFEQESQNYTSQGYTYEVKLVSVYDSTQKAIFEVNGERTDPLRKDDSYRFSDGASIFIRDVMPQKSGADLVQYNFFPAEREAASPPETLPEAAEQPAPEINKTMDAEPPAAQAPGSTTEDAAEEPNPEPPEQDPQDQESGWWARFKNWLGRLFSRG